MKTRSLVCAFLLCTFSGIAQTHDPTPQELMDAGHWKRARAAVEKLGQTKPNEAQTAFLMAEVKQAFGDLEGALPLAQKAVSLDGKNAAYHTLFGEINGSLAEKASLFKQMGLARTFRKEVELGASLDPRDIEPRSSLIEFYWEAPGMLGGDKKKCQEMVDEIAKINAVQGYLAAAQLAHLQKDVTKQQGFLEKAVEADPRHFEAQVALANYYSADAEKKYDLAEKHAREAQEIDGTRITSYDLLAFLYATEQRTKELDEILSEAEKKIPDDFGPYYQAGKGLLLANQELPRAESYFRKYLTQEPEGESPNLAAAHWRLGQVLEKENRKADAIAELQTALRLQPDFPEAKKDLKRLR